MIIKKPGIYRLKGNLLSSSDIGVKICADNVLLDLNGHSIECEKNETGRPSFGVHALNQSNVHIFNGKISGCVFGVHASYGNKNSVQGIDFSDCNYIGINMGGSGNIIRGCYFANIVGYPVEAYAIGINNPGSNFIIEGNTFRNLTRQPGVAKQIKGEGVGVLISNDSCGGIIRGNWFENRHGDQSIGIWTGIGSTAIVSENCFTECKAPVSGDNATVDNNRMLLRRPISQSKAIWLEKAGIATNNVIVGFDHALYGATIDGGGNQIIS